MIYLDVLFVADAGGLSLVIFDRPRKSIRFRSPESPVASLRVPERFRVGIVTVANLTDASFADLLKSLKSHSTDDTVAGLATKIQNEVPSISLGKCEGIIAAVSSMQAVQKSSHSDVAKFASDIWDALKEDVPEFLENCDEETIKSRMATLLAESPIHLVSTKVAELRNEIERNFCGARILTDLRTAFPDDATKRPVLTVMQTLEVMYHDDMGRHREFYVNVDDNDLIILKDAVARAIQKKATLIEMFKKTDFEMFD
jgi:hypothetical protein